MVYCIARFFICWLQLWHRRTLLVRCWMQPHDRILRADWNLLQAKDSRGTHIVGGCSNSLRYNEALYTSDYSLLTSDPFRPSGPYSVHGTVPRQ